MSTMKLDTEKFDRSVKFSLWQVKMKAILIQTGIYKVTDGLMITHDFTRSSYDSMFIKNVIYWLKGYLRYFTN